MTGAIREHPSAGSDNRLTMATAPDWSVFSLRDRWILILLGLLLVLNRGFSSILIPPGIPFAELTIVLYLVGVNWGTMFPRLLHYIPWPPYLVWWGLGIGSCLYYARVYGFWAFRDAGFVLDSLYLIVGFAMARSEKHVLFIFRTLRKILLIASFYALTPSFLGPVFGNLITVPGTHGQANVVIGQYLNTAPLVVLAAISIYIVPPRKVLLRQLAPVYFSVVLAFIALTAQSRGLYIQILAATALLLYFVPKHAWRFLLAPIAFVIALELVDISGVQINGRLGKVSLQFVLQHLLSLSGKASGEGAEGAANGILQRYSWWHSVISQWLASTTTFFFGVGFGLPLIDFTDPNGNPVRDPHNSYLSILGRMGLCGALSWAWLTAHIARRWYKAFAILSKRHSEEMRGHMLVCMFFFFTCWLGAYGEPVFEYPFNSVPYYFLAGVCIRYSGLLSVIRRKPEIGF